LPVIALLFIANLVQGVMSGKWWPFFGAALILGCAAVGFYASRRGKFLVWRELLDGLKLRGDEQILDIGCGRGAVLILAAQRLTTGRAIGVDLWRKQDQSGNAADATKRNAVAEGVADRVELHTADMTALPFENASFDVIVSSIAIHNVNRAGREKTIKEAVRVLRPGGRLMIADFLATRQYLARLKELGMTNIERINLGWRMWWTGPWLSTHLVTARKSK
jgi:ubiquinone/menaquinone biosynthesis C-methylase UbiE